jgi:hypothetical protein
MVPLPSSLISRLPFFATVIPDSYRTAPHFALRRDEAGHEILILAQRFAGRVIERYAHNFIAGAFHPVP